MNERQLRLMMTATIAAGICGNYYNVTIGDETMARDALNIAGRLIDEDAERNPAVKAEPVPVAGDDNPLLRDDGFGIGMEEIIEWAAWVDHTEGTEAGASDKVICFAHAILAYVDEQEGGGK